jgi:hypothetical protein
MGRFRHRGKETCSISHRQTAIENLNLCSLCHDSLGQYFSSGTTFSLVGYLAKSRDICDWWSLGDRKLFVWKVVREESKHLSMHRKVPPPQQGRDYLVQNVNRTEHKKPYFRLLKFPSTDRQKWEKHENHASADPGGSQYCGQSSKLSQLSQSKV